MKCKIINETCGIIKQFFKTADITIQFFQTINPVLTKPAMPFSKKVMQSLA